MGSRHRWEAGTSCLGNEGALGAALGRLILVSGGLGNYRLILFFFNFFFFLRCRKGGLFVENEEEEWREVLKRG